MIDELSASAMDGYLPSAQMQQLLDSYEVPISVFFFDKKLEI